MEIIKTKILCTFEPFNLHDYLIEFQRCHRDEAKLKPCQKYLSSSQSSGKLSEALHLSNSNQNYIGGGHYISCVFDIAFGLDKDVSNEDDDSKIPRPTPLNFECSQFLSDIESIVFSDYR